MDLSTAFLQMLADEEDEEDIRRRHRVRARIERPRLTFRDRLNIPNEQFQLENIPEFECEKLFRFKKDDIYRLRDVLALPPEVQLDEEGRAGRVDGLVALCITLRRLCYPNRLTDIAPFFCLHESTISRAFHSVIEHIVRNFSHTLRMTPQNLSPTDVEALCAAVQDAGAPLERCIGFIDGTVIEVCRPGKFQEIVFNGHKRKHALKFQAVTTADGLIRDFAGPYEGIRHDSAILAQSNFMERMQAISDLTPAGCYLYGDPAYPLTRLIVCGWKHRNLTQDQDKFNRAMSSVRISVEWGFAILKSKWAFIDFSKNLQVFSNCPGKIILAAFILTNAHTCLYGNQISKKFGVRPPPLAEYMRRDGNEIVAHD